VSTVSWLTVSTGSTGTGNGTVTYSAAVNTGASRTGTLRIAGQTVTLTQTAAACTFTISPTTQAIGQAGGPATVSLTTTSACAWTAASGVNWIAVTSATSGTGNATVSYSVSANPAASTRTGTLTIGGKTLTVTQTAGVPPGAPHNLRIVTGN
jgi:hypothetical protein